MKGGMDSISEMKSGVVDDNSLHIFIQGNKRN